MEQLLLVNDLWGAHIEKSPRLEQNALLAGEVGFRVWGVWCFILNEKILVLYFQDLRTYYLIDSHS